MVKLQTISTPNEANNNSSSSDQSSTSPISPLPPTIIIPPATTTTTATSALLLPHQFYQPPQHHYPPHQQQQQTMLYFPSYPPPHFYYSTPYPYHYQHQQPEQFYYSDNFTFPQTTLPPPDVYYSDAMDPCTRGLRNANYFTGKGFSFGNRNGFGKKRLVPVSNPKPGNGSVSGNEGIVKKKWKPKGKVNPNACANESPKKWGGCAELANSTTIMLKNIPNSLSRNTLIDMLDRHCRQQNGDEENNRHSSQSEYDFLYLPFDFMRGQNLGYAFINFTSAEGASNLFTCWKNLGWSDSKKTRAITPAKLQGLAECINHFQTSVFFCNSEDYLPLEFSPPRNGFNGNTCKGKVIGKWVFRDRSIVPVTPPRFEFRERKTSPKKSGWAKYGTPPRFNRNYAN